MTMRATQKKRMSWPVSSSEPGKNARMSAVSAGQPITLKGKSPVENLAFW